jgi:hypothetical protein
MLLIIEGHLMRPLLFHACDSLLFIVIGLNLAAYSSTANAVEPAAFEGLKVRFDAKIQSLVKTFCLDCHSKKVMEGELDLERFGTFAGVRQDPKAWQKVAQMLDNGEMPPADSDQLSQSQRRLLRTWVSNYLDAEARASAGDPGPVLLRRLNNAEYTYTIQDLTGVKLDPAREFPADSGAGEGFTNTGESLVMSPALVQKYFDAAQETASHAVLLPDGFRFSTVATRSDWTNEILHQIQALYAQHTTAAQLKGIRVLHNTEISNARKAMLQDGTVDLNQYFAALIKHRDLLIKDLAKTDEIARDEFLSAKYLRLLAKMLVTGEVDTGSEVPIVIGVDDASQPQAQRSKSLLLDSIRESWKKNPSENTASIVARIRAMQNQVWKFEPVGHLGLIRLWQNPTNPISRSLESRVKLKTSGDKNSVRVYLTAGNVGLTNDKKNASSLVVWKNPRIERPGKPPILLRDVQLYSAALRIVKEDTAKRFRQYLAAALEIGAGGATNTKINLDRVAAEHKINVAVLRAFLSYLSIGTGEVSIQRLDHPIQNKPYGFVRGWGLKGIPDISVLGNSSDQNVKIPGDSNAHKIVMHPRPERWVAAGWKSPIDGIVNLQAHVRDAHSNCGDGVEWRLEQARGTRRTVLAQGHVDLGKVATIKPVTSLKVQQGDVISVAISRRANYFCDLTEVDLSIKQIGTKSRQWSLSRDCADKISQSNPLADAYGNPSVWYFHWGMMKQTAAPSNVPIGSLLAKWVDSTEKSQRSKLADQLQQFVNSPMPRDASRADADLYKHLTDVNGPLFSGVNPAELSKTVTPDQLTEADRRSGIDAALFGKMQLGRAVAASDIAVTTPSVVEFDLPSHLIDDAEFVVSAALADTKNDSGIVQLTATTTPPHDPQTIIPGAPFIVRAGSSGEKLLIKSLDEFRALFPLSMCHARIVPVDEVVTLLLFHREDHHLIRLMLSKAEHEELERLWSELHFVSQDAVRTLASLEQILEFATQDADPRKFDPVLEPIANNARAFRRQLLKTERVHLDALVRFANQAFRRELTPKERKSIRDLYGKLRLQQIDHEEAFRLTLAKVLSSPSFLYRLEKRDGPIAKVPSGNGYQVRYVSDWELASRLSYFLWSSAPDERLRKEAKARRLHLPNSIEAQTKRMLGDPRIRRMSIEFGCQWLHIRDFDAFDEKSETHFPDFVNLRGDMYEESIQVFTHFFQEDGSILELIDGDHTFVNDRIAKFYGIPNVTGSEWRRIENARKFSRGGILTQAATLSRQSGASRTSPILRGNWVAETLLGERLPRPPKNVPDLPSDESKLQGLTIRQLVEKHSTDASCAKCHKRIDPYGFALESFDSIGRYREKDGGRLSVDTSTTLIDGTKIKGADGLRNYLVKQRRSDFVRHFCRKLLGYACGRATQLSDEPLLDEMVELLEKNDHRISVAIRSIVLSQQFRTTRATE